MKKFLLLVVFVFICTGLFAVPRPSSEHTRPSRPDNSRPAQPRKNHRYDIDFIRPSSVKKLEDSKACELSIQTNVSSAEVYINNHYEGRTNLLVDGLRPGNYIIEIRKNGYEDELFEIELRPGYRSIYSIDMIKIMGKIDIHDLPSSAYLYVDGSSKSGNIIEIEPGYHTVEIRRFGYNPYSERVYVEAYEYTDVYPEFSEADFEIYNLKSSREKINPEYDNLFGRTEFSFTVTARGSAELQVKNEEGTVVWNHKWKSFSSWNQSITFYGKNSAGEPLPDGLYTVCILADGYSDELSLYLDRGASYSLMGINTKGSGIGSMPAVFNNGVSLIVPYIQAGYLLNEKVDESFFDIQIGLLFDFGNHYEFNLAIGALPGSAAAGSKQMQFSTSFKFYDLMPLGNYTFCYGGLVHWAFVNESLYLPAGIDTGNGLGFAVIAGFDMPNLYLGFSSDYIFAAESGRSFKSGSVWKNGLTASVKIGKKLNLDCWGALNSAINNPKLLPSYTTELLNAVDYGAELLFTFGSSSAMGSAKIERVKQFTGPGFVKIGFGLSYLL